MHTDSIHVPCTSCKSTVKMAEGNEMQNHSERPRQPAKINYMQRIHSGKELLWGKGLSNYFHQKEPFEETIFECAEECKLSVERHETEQCWRNFKYLLCKGFACSFTVSFDSYLSERKLFFALN